jgi:hypothetical protein
MMDALILRKVKIKDLVIPFGCLPRGMHKLNYNPVVSVLKVL